MFPTDAQWQDYRGLLLKSPGAAKQARALLSAKYGKQFADLLVNFILNSTEVPNEANFADELFYTHPEVFEAAWAERIDLRGRKIGDQVDVTSDAVRDLWDQFETTRKLDNQAVELSLPLEERVKLAAATYVEITRDELETWLAGLKYPWDRAAGTEGIYLLHLSDNVAIKLSTTLGGKGKVMQVGQASMQLALVSLITGNVINKKAQGQSYFARTTGWKTNWAIGIKRMEDAYRPAAGFYEVIAAIPDREAYQKENIARIEAIPWWAGDGRLEAMHAKLQQRGVLMPRDLDIIEDEAARITKLLEDLRDVYKIAHSRQDASALKFIGEVGKKIKEGKPLSSTEWSDTLKYLQQYKINHRMANRLLSAMIKRISQCLA